VEATLRMKWVPSAVATGFGNVAGTKTVEGSRANVLYPDKLKMPYLISMEDKQVCISVVNEEERMLSILMCCSSVGGTIWVWSPW